MTSAVTAVLLAGAILAVASGVGRTYYVRRYHALGNRRSTPADAEAVMRPGWVGNVGFLGWALVGLGIVGLIVVAAPEADEDEFADVPRAASYHRAVQWLHAEGITQGSADGEFQPHAVVTRAQLAVFLWRMMDRPDVRAPHDFSDVDSDAHYEDAVRWLRAEGITTGTGDDPPAFLPHQPVTRGQAAIFLWRLAGEPDTDGGQPFSDVALETPADVPVRWMARHDITTPADSATGFHPGDPLTRAQMAAFLHRLAGNAAAWDPYVEPPSTTRF
jgi:hypothetical protein